MASRPLTRPIAAIRSRPGFSAGGQAREAPIIEKVFYILECGVENCRAEFWLNDIPVTLRGQEEGVFFGGPVNPLVQDEMNEISILVHPGKTPATRLTGGAARSRFDPGDARAWAKLSWYPFGSIVGGPDGMELLAAEWTGTPGQPEVFPKVVTKRGHLGDLFGPWLWHTAPPLALDEEEREQIDDVLETLRNAFDNGDVEPFMKRSQTRLDDLEKSHGLEPGEKSGIIRLLLRKDMANPWWGMQPIARQGMVRRLCGGNRLVQLLAGDGKPPLREKPEPDGSVSYYDMILGKVGGDWHIVR